MKNTRREFLTKLGVTVGAVTFGKNIMEALPLPSDEYQKEGIIRPQAVPKLDETVDFRYAPKDWQSTFCFPDDPSKNLVGKLGDLRCGHPGTGSDEKIFPHRISFGLKGKEPLQYLDQKLESPAIPIITTKLDGGEVIVETITFASKNESEGRVDNVIVHIYPKSENGVDVEPEIVIASESKFLFNKEEEHSVVKHSDSGKIFLITDHEGVLKEEQGIYRIQYGKAKATIEKPYKIIVRLPQEDQDFDKLEDGFDELDDLMKNTREFWKSWKPTEGKVVWNLGEPYEDFRIACTRNILESREIKDGKRIFQVGPTCYRGLWIVDGHFLLEAARYLGYDKEAQEGLVTIWNRQDAKGLFTAGAGEAHWKDTAVAVYALIRQAELSQNWDYFNEMYPDAYKAIDALHELMIKAKGDGTTNGKYGILPRGFGDSGIGGIRDEYTNTLWAIIATKALAETAERLRLIKTVELKSYYGELWFPFMESTKIEMKQHPKGFKYLPMLMASDPKWQEVDERKQPRPQAAQIYLSHAIFPGLLFNKSIHITDGHVKLMESVMKEDIPIETGWLTNNALWPYNAAIFAQTCLQLGRTDLARKVFFGFLNHASPLYTWREEQSLQSEPIFNFIGDMPHNWASAECIRFLRHRLILEDERNLVLLNGIGLADMESDKPLGLSYSPTRWGRVTVEFKRIDGLSWNMKFRREDFNQQFCPPLEYITMPAVLGGSYHLFKTNGAKSVRNGEIIYIKGNELEWDCVWKKWK
ncbi:MAG: hypothetical protein HZB59_01800 [Ignavibacteriales bacterium]|nr:hypothetical protein [Ignavibacteriales bacterium]